MKCLRKDCDLTALWQVKLEFRPKWSPTNQPIEVFTSLVICGLHKENVTISDFGNIGDLIARATKTRDSSLLSGVVECDDISDGKWTDPRRPQLGKVPVPDEDS